MKRPYELLEEFRRTREQMTPKQRVEAYHAFNDALTEALKESSRWQIKTKPRG